MTTLQQASQAQVNKTDYDMIDYLNELREGCLEAYTGIVQGLKGDADSPNPDVALVQPHVNHIVSFIEHIAVDDDKSDSNVSACCGLIGDLCSAFGSSMLPMVDRDSISNLLTQGRRSKMQKAKTLATWATKEIRRLKNAASSCNLLQTAAVSIKTILHQSPSNCSSLHQNYPTPISFKLQQPPSKLSYTNLLQTAAVSIKTILHQSPSPLHPFSSKLH
ncbi:importin subunit beta-1 [Plakobranchus ocellatus]|uniref:Importin subunit beta-1 n=1 Tax=Plakobranchus ocellatus TaxID=259542 RepID=A0AAV3ZWS9_9GAST|nr:importin subunit beta-1 [Plakobranchus ocellatus]